MHRNELSKQIEILYGRCEWTETGDCLHVAAVHGPSARVIAIGPTSPPSVFDRLALGLARARAGVILTTGAILRAEPDLVHRYSEDPEEDRALADWRQRVLGRSESPRLLVLSGSGDFLRDAPALREADGWIWTTPSGAARLGAAPDGFEIVVRENAGDAAVQAIRFAWEQAESKPVLVEAGPTTTRSLYAEEGSSLVDELLLSRYEGKLEASAVGPAFIDEATLARVFDAPISSVVIEEASGPWRFERSRSDDRP